MRVRTLLLTLPALILATATPVLAQTFPTDDAVVERIWE